MKHDKFSKLKDHTDALEKIYQQRRLWLYASSVVFTAIILVIFSWDVIDTQFPKSIWWVLISIGLLVSVNWWYWTMKSLTTLVRSMHAEYEILNEVTTDIAHVKIIIKSMADCTNNCESCPVNDGCIPKK